MLKLTDPKFIQAIYDYAFGFAEKKNSEIPIVYEEPRVIAALVTAQAVHESNLLVKPSKLSIWCKNLFGMKARAGEAHLRFVTEEVSNGLSVKAIAGFKQYDTYEEAIEDLLWRLYGTSLRYLHVRVSESFEEAAIATKACGYATDPTYAQKLCNVYRTLLSGGHLQEPPYE